MSRKRQKNQLYLTFMEESRGEAPMASIEGTELFVAKQDLENPAETENLMEEICEKDNLWKALKRVKANKGAPGVDGMTVEELPSYLVTNWPKIRKELFCGSYKPQPVRRVEIPKPGKAGLRKLGIPSCLDRFIQQAVLQKLQGKWDEAFSERSYGFRPGRSAHQAVEQAQNYIAQGKKVCVDLDLEKFFDEVCHDKLMSLLCKRIKDKRVLRLIRSFLQAGVMMGGLVSPTFKGTPQGGPLSPLLSNVMLDPLDKELEKRDLCFVRYADDCKIYVRSKRAGKRVMENISRFIEKRLRLKVNWEKSATDYAWRRDLLGFSFTAGAKPRRRLARQTIKRFKHRVRQITRRKRGIGLEQRITELSKYLVGWRGYYGFCQTMSILEKLDSWIHRRLRCTVWIQWKRGPNRFAELRKRGVGKDLAAQTAGSSQGPWHLSRSPALNIALPRKHLLSLGLPLLVN